MSDHTNVLKAPVGGRYDRGWCEPNPKVPEQCIDDSIRVPPEPSTKPRPDDRFVRDLNPLISKKIQRQMRNPAWRARQIAMLKEDMKEPTPTVGDFFGNMAKIVALPFAVFGAGCVFDRSGIAPPDGTVQPDAARHDAGDADVTDDGAVDGATDGTTPVDGSPDTGTDSGTPVDDRPTITWPYLGTLPNNRAFVRWNPPQDTPPGKTRVGYEVSWSDGTNNYSKEVIFPFTAIDILSPNTMYQITVRAKYNDATYGQDSVVKQVVADTSLMARYTMDEGAGNMIMDSSGNGNHGTLVNFDPLTAWTQGIIGTGLLFDGVDSYVDTGDTFNFDSTDPFTIEAWVRRGSVGSYQTIFARTDYLDPANTFRGSWIGYTDADRLRFSLYNDWSSGNVLTVVSATQFNTANQPQNLTFTYDGSALAAGSTMYLNGAAQATTANDNLSGTTLNSVPSRIGAAIAVGGPVHNVVYPMNGAMDDLAIYGRALSVDEVLNNTCSREALHSEEVGDATGMPANCN